MKSASKHKALALLFFVIIILTLGLRLWNIPGPDYYPDETLYAQTTAKVVNQGLSVYEASVWTPPLSTYFMKYSYNIFGINKFSSRFPTVLFGLLSIWIIYLLSRLYFNKKVSVIAALLLAVSPLHVINSTIGFIDVIMAFFAITAIYFSELYFNKSKKRFIWLSAFFFALSFLTKYNTIMVWGFYWIFLFARSIITKDRIQFMKQLFSAISINVLAGFFVFLFVVITGGIGRIFLIVHTAFLLFTIQATSAEFPWYYYDLAFINWLSPLVYLLFIVSFILFIKKYILKFQIKAKEKEIKGVYLMWFLVIVNIFVLVIVPRSAARHFVPMLPFLIIVCAYGLYQLSSYIKNKRIWVSIVAIILISSFAWSAYEVNKVQSYTYWDDVAIFIQENHPNAKINMHQASGSPLGFMVDNEIVGATYLDLEYVVPDKNELVIFSYVEQTPGTRDTYPLDNNLIFYSKVRDWASTDFQSYVEDNGKKVFTGYYNDKPAVVVYEIESVPINLTPTYKRDQHGIKEPSLISKLWIIMCTAYGFNPTQQLIDKTFSQDLLVSVKSRCS